MTVKKLLSRVETPYLFRGGPAHCRLRTAPGVSNVLSCRLGCIEDESIDHVLICCPFLKTERKHIHVRCNKLNIQMTVIELLTNPKLRFLVESLLSRFLHY